MQTRGEKLRGETRVHAGETHFPKFMLLTRVDLFREKHLQSVPFTCLEVSAM